MARSRLSCGEAVELLVSEGYKADKAREVVVCADVKYVGQTAPLSIRLSGASRDRRDAGGDPGALWRAARADLRLSFRRASRCSSCRSKSSAAASRVVARPARASRARIADQRQAGNAARVFRRGARLARNARAAARRAERRARCPAR